MEYLPINDLPNELLELIFDHLDGNDLKVASLVCKRWSDLAFSGRRMDRVLLVATFPWDKDLLQSNRKYRHIELGGTEKCSAHVKELFQTCNVSSLRIKGYLSHSSLRLIFLEVPNLQHLSIWFESRQMNEKSEPFPVMGKLERLEIRNFFSKISLPWHTIAPSLQGLKMDCNYEDQLEQLRLFSGQLKHVSVDCNQINSWTRFCGMTFPLLEELSMNSNRFGVLHDFFQRNASLQRLRLDGFILSKTLVEAITNHSKKLTSLEIIAFSYVHESNGEAGSLESLSLLTELKHLRLVLRDPSIVRGCEALTSLQSLSIRGARFSHISKLGFLEDIFKIAPQLRCLELGSVVMPASAVHFICHHFTKLTRLLLKYSEKVTHDGLSEIHRLPLLSYLELKMFATNRLFIGIIQSKVRCLSLHLPCKYNENDLLRLPEIFPQLDRLNLINSRKFLHESTVDKLRQLLPTCAIIIYGPLITNVGMKRCVRKWTRGEMMPVWEKEWVWKN